MVLASIIVILLFTCYGVGCVDSYPSEPDKWNYEADYCENMVKKLWLNSTHYFQKTIYCSI